MLVLSRKPGEALRVGEDVEITVVEVKGEMVRLGIQAPRDVQVWRKELWEAIVAENIKAAEEAAAATSAKPVPVIPVPAMPVRAAKAGVSDLLAKKKKK
ncbi:MAG: carbon storage regulator CsrA [Synergistaceae bacterium]|jgi:carbon storage regulator|nr:carbon storage regulator CsrA [Synergistaceae bacterium]